MIYLKSMGYRDCIPDLARANTLIESASIFPESPLEIPSFKANQPSLAYQLYSWWSNHKMQTG
jgi:hypothetical protein